MFATNPALVLNADFQPLSYFPLSLFHWDDAIKAVVKGSHAVVAEYDQVERSPSTMMQLPWVIALRDYVRPASRVAFTRFNVFLRDRFRCQYCGDRQLRGELTFDHVVPRADGGGNLMGQHRGGLRPLQHAQGPLPDHADPDAAGADHARSDVGAAFVSAELPARDLARLPLLGCRAGDVRRRSPIMLQDLPAA
jgi:5-methylcytosine-specific restriction endonuclease McrA